MTKIAIGIDPGLKGGVSVIQDGNLLSYGVLPTVKELSVKGKVISRPDVEKMYTMLKSIKEYCSAISEPAIAIERQVAMPGQNSVSTFNTGKGYGMILAVIYILFGRENVHIISCKDWQSELITERTFVEKSRPKREKRKQLKCDSIAAAKELFKVKQLKATKRSTADHDGIADSSLIGYYCYKHFT